MLLPLQLLGQQGVRFVDTVTVSGYYYQFAWIPNYRVKAWTGSLAGDYDFVSDSLLAGRTIGEYMATYYKYVMDKEKFLSKPPDESFRPYEEADSATLQWARKVITINPYELGVKAPKVKGRAFRAWVTRVTVQWIKLDVDAYNALHKFDRPPSIDAYAVTQKGRMNVYLPLRLLSIEKHIKWWRMDAGNRRKNAFSR